MTIVVIGDVMDDVLVRVRAPVAFGSDTDSEIRCAPGGSGANQAAWIGSLGVPVRFYGRVGAPDVARHEHALCSAGVEPHLAGDPDLPTGSIVVLVAADGERTMFTDRGANHRLTAEDLPMSLEGVAHLHVSGYSFFDERPAAHVAALVQAAADRSIPSSVDPSSESYIARIGKAAFFARTHGVSLAFPNAAEARLLTGRDEPAEAAVALTEHYETVALKLGATGAVVAVRGAEPVKVPSPEVRVVDTTGAGDAFCAGFLAAQLAGGLPEACARLGVATAAGALGHLGGRPHPG
jgi:sugar/nucleoside kinase (ribokinase family)